jgi:hypothetical protein
MEQRRFVIEAVMLASYGQLLVPDRPVQYIIPYSSLMELYEMVDSPEPVMEDPEDDKYVKRNIRELIRFFEEPLNRKKIEKALSVPWRASSPLIVNDLVSIVVVNAYDMEQYGESFDPIETELVVIAGQNSVPVLTDQIEFTEKVIEHEVPVQVFDVEDYEYALEAEG